MPTLIAAKDLKPQPWKNGGGVTREIAVEPPGADMESFAWRVSTAEVASDGPFSRFDGIDRVLVLLTGAGMSLTIDGAAPVLLTPASDPLPFAADVPVSATLPAGAITDLNIMVRRGAWSARVERRALEVVTPVRCETGVVLVMAESGDVTRIEADETTMAGPGRVVVIQLSPA